MSLSTITGETRTILKWGAIILGILLVIFVLMKIKNSIFPAPPPPPTVGFGKLPQIEFPKNSINKNFTYSINTISGHLPDFAPSEKVFKTEEVTPDLLSLNRAKDKAKGVGFSDNPTKVSENVYQWKNSEGQVLTMNTLSFNFNLSSDFLSKNIPTFQKDTESAKTAAKNYLLKIGSLPSDLDETKTTTELFSVKNFKMAPATSLSQTQVVRVNFFQKDFNNLPIFYPEQNSPMNFTLGFEEPQVLEANFFYQKPTDVFSTYPLKTSDAAFENLKNGKAYINYSPTSTFVPIKKVKLGYFIGEKNQNFLLPIVVFEGDNFQAYVSAIKDEWVNK